LRFVLVLLLLLRGAISLAQYPNHYVLGKDQCANTDIFNVYATEDNKIYLATNNDVYVRRQNNFIRVKSCPEQKGSSFFDFKTDCHRQLFVKNNRGHVFEVTRN